MLLKLRQEQGVFGKVLAAWRLLRIDGSNKFLPHNVAHKMLLRRIDRAGLPEQTHPLKKRIDDLEHGILKAISQHASRDCPLKPLLIQLDHRQAQGIDLKSKLIAYGMEVMACLVDFQMGHLGDAGNLVAVAI